MDIFRIFDSLNYVPNIIVGMEAVGKAGICHVFKTEYKSGNVSCDESKGHITLSSQFTFLPSLAAGPLAAHLQTQK